MFCAIVLATMTIKLPVEKRDGKAASVRKSGQVPGIVYGPKQEPIPVKIDGNTFAKVLDEAGEATIINLDGLGDTIEVLIHDVAFDAARGGVEHVDFYAIERGKELTTNVPLEFVGEAPATKTGATVNKALYEVEVTCRPSDLPAHIEVDISTLVDEESQIKLGDLTIPAGVTVSGEPDWMVATISAAREEEPEDTEAGSVDMDAVAVETKGKEATEAETT